jgi:hypothetical protein
LHAGNADRTSHHPTDQDRTRSLSGWALISPLRDADTPKGRPIAPLIVGQWPEDETTIFEIGFEPSSDQSAVDGTLQLRMPGRELLEHAFELALRDPDLSGT